GERRRRRRARGRERAGVGARGAVEGVQGDLGGGRARGHGWKLFGARYELDRRRRRRQGRTEGKGRLVGACGDKGRHAETSASSPVSEGAFDGVGHQSSSMLARVVATELAAKLPAMAMPSTARPFVGRRSHVSAFTRCTCCTKTARISSSVSTRGSVSPACT